MHDYLIQRIERRELTAYYLPSTQSEIMDHSLELERDFDNPALHGTLDIIAVKQIRFIDMWIEEQRSNESGSRLIIDRLLRKRGCI